MSDWRSLPSIRNDSLVFEDTSGIPQPGSIVPCLMCTKPFIMRMFTGAPDQVCPECWETYKDAARIICWKCRVTIMRVKPGVLDNGYYIRPRAVLHASACNVCQEGLRMCQIIEITEWQKRVREPKIIVPMGFNRR
jgi:hypothetical protein